MYRHSKINVYWAMLISLLLITQLHPYLWFIIYFIIFCWLEYILNVNIFSRYNFIRQTVILILIIIQSVIPTIPQIIIYIDWIFVIVFHHLQTMTCFAITPLMWASMLFVMESSNAWMATTKRGVLERVRIDKFTQKLY